MKIEIWKDIPNYEGIYKVSNLGNVKSLMFGKEKILKLQKTGTGYYFLNLWKDKKYKVFQIHILVAMVFLDYKPTDNYIIIDHIDNDPLNNTIGNLQIITRRKNASKDQFRYNRSSIYTGVSWDKNNNRWKSQIRINSKNKYLGSFINEIDAHKAYQNKLKELNQ